MTTSSNGSLFPNSTQDVIIGVDIGGTKISVLVVDQNNTELAEFTALTDVTSEQNTLNSIVAAIETAVSHANKSHTNIIGIGIGLPGKINPATGHVDIAVNLNWHNYPARQKLSQTLNVPCYLENDVRLAALGCLYLLYPDIQNLIYVTIGTGVAAGVILNGQPFRGSHNTAGEIGHAVMNPQGPLCKCGNRGCLEAMVAGPALANYASQAADGILAEINKERPVTAVDLFQAAQQNDPTAQKIIQNVGSILGQALQNLVMAYDPDKIILGGGVSHAGDIFLQSILQEWHRQIKISPFAAELLNPDKLELSPQNHNLGTWGGIALIKENYSQAEPSAYY